VARLWKPTHSSRAVAWFFASQRRNSAAEAKYVMPSAFGVALS
jgi:hypothetical protein